MIDGELNSDIKVEYKINHRPVYSMWAWIFVKPTGFHYDIYVYSMGHHYPEVSLEARVHSIS